MSESNHNPQNNQVFLIVFAVMIIMIIALNVVDKPQQNEPIVKTRDAGSGNYTIESERGISHYYVDGDFCNHKILPLYISGPFSAGYHHSRFAETGENAGTACPVLPWFLRRLP